ncbi:Thioredoxin [Holothuria leucospilota]|uniref:Thioredoxin n=1 Tax=Holothuria leucospilota TaxID=206669 RepID=A0A9Q1C902_HOLLE|nr:Thioredoxin [Holothuria leucospilota]
MPVQEIADHSSFMKLLEEAGDKLVLVDFYACWCGPCKQIANPLKKLSDDPKYASVIFAKVDVDVNGETAEACEINCMPTFQFFHQAKKVEEFSGANKAKLIELLNSLVEKYSK